MGRHRGLRNRLFMWQRYTQLKHQAYFLLLKVQAKVRSK